MRLTQLILLGGCVITASMIQNANAGKWGMAGCGVGSLIFEDQPGKIQLLSATTNQYFVQTSSITSGTSNCTDDGREQASLFIAINQESLRKDISRGSGEAVDGLARIYQCEKQGEFGVALQKNFGAIYPTEQGKPDEVRAKIEAVVRENRDLAKSCKVLS